MYANLVLFGAAYVANLCMRAVYHITMCFYKREVVLNINSISMLFNYGFLGFLWFTAVEIVSLAFQCILIVPVGSRTFMIYLYIYM